MIAQRFTPTAGRIVSREHRLPVGKRPYRSLEEVIAGLTSLEDACIAQQDRRGVFVTAYLEITCELAEWIENRRFHDGAWVARYAVAFADLYRQSLVAHVDGIDRAGVQAWRLAFQSTTSEKALVIQDLLLGINAHINHDLPLALLHVGIDPDQERRFEDHTTINEALEVVTIRLRRRFEAMYAGVLDGAQHLLGQFLEAWVGYAFRESREHSWKLGVALIESGSSHSALARLIDQQAVFLGRMLLAPNYCLSEAIEVLLAAEAQNPWWEFLGDRESPISATNFVERSILA